MRTTYLILIFIIFLVGCTLLNKEKNESTKINDSTTVQNNSFYIKEISEYYTIQNISNESYYLEYKPNIPAAEQQAKELYSCINGGETGYYKKTKEECTCPNGTYLRNTWGGYTCYDPYLVVPSCSWMIYNENLYNLSIRGYECYEVCPFGYESFSVTDSGPASCNSIPLTNKSYLVFARNLIMFSISEKKFLQDYKHNRCYLSDMKLTQISSDKFLVQLNCAEVNKTCYLFVKNDSSYADGGCN